MPFDLKIKRVEEAIKNGNYAAAIEILDSLPEDSKESFAAVRAMCLSKSGDYSSAQIAYEKLFSQTRQPVDVQVGFLENLIYQERWTDAVQLAESILLVDEHNNDAHFFLARFAYETDQFDEALNHLSSPMERFQDNPDYHHLLAKTLDLLNFDKAPHHIVTAQQLAPENRQILIDGVQILIRYSEFKLANEWLQRLIIMEPTNPEYLFQHGLVCVQLNDYQNAIKALNAAKKNDSDRLEIDLLKAVALHKLNMIDDAHTLLDELSIKEPNNHLPHLYRAKFFIDDNKITEALTCIKAVLDIDPNCTEAFELLNLASTRLT
ncbi:hypothetical protein EB093_07540 [bacterium]|nr:hypothetical protein [bacterium]